MSRLPSINNAVRLAYKDLFCTLVAELPVKSKRIRRSDQFLQHYGLDKKLDYTYHKFGQTDGMHMTRLGRMTQYASRRFLIPTIVETLSFSHHAQIKSEKDVSVYVIKSTVAMMVKQNISVPVLSSRSGIAESTIYSLLKTPRNITVGTAMRLLLVFGGPLRWIYANPVPVKATHNVVAFKPKRLRVA